MMKWSQCVAHALLVGLFIAGAVEPADAAQVVVLGDSLSDTGNLYTLSGGALPPHPNGDPTQESLYDPGRSPKRFSNGDVWTDYAAATLGLQVNSVWTGNPVNPIQLRGNGYVDNFAVANSFTGSYKLNGALSSDPSYSNWTDLVATQLLGQPFAGLPGLRQQTDLYLLSGVSPNAVHIVWAGANDLFFAPFLNTGNVAQSAVDNVIGVLNDLHRAGATQLVVANLPNLGATPVARGETSLPFNPPLGNNQAALATASTAYNQLLWVALDNLGFLVKRVDIDALLSLALQNAQALGFDNITDPCLNLSTLASECSNPNSYLFWDEMHPSSHAHGLIGTAFVQEIPLPTTLLLMLVPLAFLGACGGHRRIVKWTPKSRQECSLFKLGT